MAFATSIFSVFVKSDTRIPYAYGLIIFPMVIPVVAGCVISSPLGVTLAKKIPPRTIQVMFTTFLVLVVSNMIYKLWL